MIPTFITPSDDMIASLATSASESFSSISRTTSDITSEKFLASGLTDVFLAPTTTLGLRATRFRSQMRCVSSSMFIGWRLRTASWFQCAPYITRSVAIRLRRYGSMTPRDHPIALQRRL